MHPSTALLLVTVVALHSRCPSARGIFGVVFPTQNNTSGLAVQGASRAADLATTAVAGEGAANIAGKVIGALDLGGPDFQAAVSSDAALGEEGDKTDPRWRPAECDENKCIGRDAPDQVAHTDDHTPTKIDEVEFCNNEAGCTAIRDGDRQFAKDRRARCKEEIFEGLSARLDDNGSVSTSPEAAPVRNNCMGDEKSRPDKVRFGAEPGAEFQCSGALPRPGGAPPEATRSQCPAGGTQNQGGASHVSQPYSKASVSGNSRLEDGTAAVLADAAAREWQLPLWKGAWKEAPGGHIAVCRAWGGVCVDSARGDHDEKSRTWAGRRQFHGQLQPPCRFRPDKVCFGAEPGAEFQCSGAPPEATRSQCPAGGTQNQGGASHVSQPYSKASVSGNSRLEDGTAAVLADAAAREWQLPLWKAGWKEASGGHIAVCGVVDSVRWDHTTRSCQDDEEQLGLPGSFAANHGCMLYDAWQKTHKTAVAEQHGRGLAGAVAWVVLCLAVGLAPKKRRDAAVPTALWWATAVVVVLVAVGPAHGRVPSPGALVASHGGPAASLSAGAAPCAVATVGVDCALVAEATPVAEGLEGSPGGGFRARSVRDAVELRKLSSEQRNGGLRDVKPAGRAMGGGLRHGDGSGGVVPTSAGVPKFLQASSLDLDLFCATPGELFPDTSAVQEAEAEVAVVFAVEGMPPQQQVVASAETAGQLFVAIDVCFGLGVAGPATGGESESRRFLQRASPTPFEGRTVRADEHLQLRDATPVRRAGTDGSAIPTAATTCSTFGAVPTAVPAAAAAYAPLLLRTGQLASVAAVVAAASLAARRPKTSSATLAAALKALLLGGGLACAPAAMAAAAPAAVVVGVPAMLDGPRGVVGSQRQLRRRRLLDDAAIAALPEWDCASTTGEYKLTADCSVGGTVTIGGSFSLWGVLSGGGVKPKVSGGNSHRIFRIGAGDAVHMQDVELTEGYAVRCGGVPLWRWRDPRKGARLVSLVR